MQLELSVASWLSDAAVSCMYLCMSSNVLKLHKSATPGDVLTGSLIVSMHVLSPANLFT